MKAFPIDRLTDRLTDGRTMPHIEVGKKEEEEKEVEGEEEKEKEEEEEEGEEEEEEEEGNQLFVVMFSSSVTIVGLAYGHR